MKLPIAGYKLANSSDRQRGYVLLGLLLVMCLFAIAAAAVAPTIAFQIKRDREEEFIHRGVQYSRAVRRYAKSTGRYPLTLEDLNGKEGMRYIRKLYKDPITGRDFKLLYTRDIMAATANVPQNGQPVQGDNSIHDPNQDQNIANPPADQQNNSNPTNTSSNLGNQLTSPQSGLAAPTGAAAQPGSSNGLTLGTIFGVVSTSKEKTIREFEHKNHYNEWLFFYDLNHDTGHLVTGPTRLTLPPTNQFGQPAAPSGQPSAGTPSSTFGQTGGSPQQPATPPTN